MSVPAIAYKANVPGFPAQAVTNSEWPAYAAVSAYGCALRGGNLNGATGGNGVGVLLNYLEKQDIPSTRSFLWASAVCRPTSIRDPLTDVLPLDPYQWDGVDAMSTAGGVLAFKCGLGKTMPSVAFALNSGLTNRCWILAPLNAFGAWQRYLPLLRQRFADVQVISIDSVHKIEPGTPSTGGVLICDEVHKLGDPKARRTQAALRLRLKFDVGIALTATLTTTGIMKATVAIQLAVPGMAGFASRWKAAEYFHCIQKNEFGCTILKPEGEYHEAFLEYLHARHVVSLSYASPSVLASVAIPDQDLATVVLGDLSRPLAGLATGYVRGQLALGTHIPTAQETAHYLCREGIEAKTAWLLDRLASGNQCVTFARYHESLDTIEEAFREAEISYLRVDGQTNSKPLERQAVVNSFQAGEVQVYLGQMDAASVSADLFASHWSVAVDHSWQPESYDQALGRTRRRGQLHRCSHDDLIANGLQAVVVERLRSGRAFDASVAEYQDIKRAISNAA